MLESRAKLEQILELLLAEDTERAEELLHEYVVSKARAEYERVLESEDEDEDDLDETIDQSNDFEDDITADEDEIEADESGLSEEGEEEAEDDMLDMGDEEGEEEEGKEEEGEDDLEDKVDELEAELADLRADFDKLMADEAGEEEHDDIMGDMNGEVEDDELAEDDFESFSYDLDEEIDEDSEVVEEATKLQDKVPAPKAGQDDSPKTFAAPKKRFQLGGQTVPKNHDGSDGNAGANKPKDNTPTDNIGIKPAKAKIQH